jgi:SPP1 family predicted phage head-tail adaptor
MDAGKLRHRIKIQKPTETKDQFGHRLKTWTDVVECWAEVRPTGSNERLVAFQMQTGQSHVITARWQAVMDSVTGNHRIVFQSRLFNIIGRPRNVTEKDTYIVFDTAEGLADGH